MWKEVKSRSTSLLNFKGLVFTCAWILVANGLHAQVFYGKGRPITDFNGTFYRDFYPIQVSGLDSCNQTFGLEKVCFTIQHPRVSDLKIELMAPDGNSIWLSNRNGGENGANYLQTCFAYNAFNGHIFEGAAPFGGTYIPDGRMGIFNEGSNPNGTWFLIIRDLATGKTGELTSWSIQFGTHPVLENESYCTDQNALPCQCPRGNDSCELLPDLIVSYKISDNHKAFYNDEHPRYSNQFRLAAALANVGFGPLEFIGTNIWLCGNDTVEGSVVCDDGEYSRRLVNQMIHVKNGADFEIELRPAGTVYYSDEPGHDHFHADDWVLFKLLKKPWYTRNPAKFRVIKVGSKISYCLFDSGNCTRENEFCQGDSVDFYGPENLPNYGFGTFNACNSDHQGISVGGYDYYGLDFEGQFIQLDKKPKRGSYFIMITVDPENRFAESDESNNTILLPVSF
ncbi:hypothetical protein GC194_14740 [bacterium]|nr:hypothetical protein [bacterium]